jgi:tetratricopeptide (TPR) repeat protein
MTRDRPSRLAGNRRLRRWLIIGSLPFAVVGVMLALKLMGLSSVAGTAIDRYEAGDYTSSADSSTSLLDLNFFEPWIPYFDRGSALAESGDLVPAIDDFEKALDLAPEDRRCEVVLNLSLGWERLADGYAEAGYYAGAELLYQTAEDVLATEDCTPPDQPVDGRDLGDELDGAADRLAQKEGAAQFYSDAQDAPEDDPSTPEEQRDQLGDRGDQAQQQKSDDDATDRSGGGFGGYTDTPW